MLLFRSPRYFGPRDQCQCELLPATPAAPPSFLRKAWLCFSKQRSCTHAYWTASAGNAGKLAVAIEAAEKEGVAEPLIAKARQQLRQKQLRRGGHGGGGRAPPRAGSRTSSAPGTHGRCAAPTPHVLWISHYATYMQVAGAAESAKVRLVRTSLFVLQRCETFS